MDNVENVRNFAKDKELTVLTNVGSLLFDRKGRLIFLSVTMYTLIEKDMNVIMSDRTVFKFKEYGSGLYYYDMARNDE